MLDLVDNWFNETGGLALDVYRQMRREEHTMQRFQGNSPLLDFRRRLIDWMEMAAHTMLSKRGRPLALSQITLHLAVYLFDIYVDRTPQLSSNDIHLMAAVSLRLAAKLEEHEARIPHPDVLNMMIRRDRGTAMTAYSAAWYSEYERRLIGVFNWRLMLPTAPQFAVYFLSVAADDVVDHFSSPSASGSSRSPIDICTPPNHVLGMNTPSRPRTRLEMKMLIERHVRKSLAMSLKVLRIRSAAPSLIAAACVALAREQLDMYPRWTQRLAQVSGYIDHSFSPLSNAMSHLRTQIVAETLAQMQYGYQQCAPTPNHEPMYAPMLPTAFIPSTPVVFAMSDHQVFTQQQRPAGQRQVNAEQLRIYACDWTGGYSEQRQLVAFPSVNGLHIVTMPTPQFERMQQQQQRQQSNIAELHPICRVPASRGIKGRRGRVEAAQSAPKLNEDERFTAGGQDSDPVVVVIEKMAAVHASIVVSSTVSTTAAADSLPERRITRSMTTKTAIKRPWPAPVIERQKRIKKAIQ